MPGSRVTRDMTRLRFLPVAGVLLATILTVTACGAASTREQAAFADALASWKNAAAATAATMNVYLLQAANHLRGSGYPGLRHRHH